MPSDLVLHFLGVSHKMVAGCSGFGKHRVYICDLIIIIGIIHACLLLLFFGGGGGGGGGGSHQAKILYDTRTYQCINQTCVIIILVYFT